MARDKVTYESYEQDVFDNPPKGPVGVHRGSRSVISRIAPFVIVILVAALCGFGAWAWVTGEYKNILNLNIFLADRSDFQYRKEGLVRRQVRFRRLLLIPSPRTTDSSNTQIRFRRYR